MSSGECGECDEYESVSPHRRSRVGHSVNQTNSASRLCDERCSESLKETIGLRLLLAGSVAAQLRSLLLLMSSVL